MMGHVVQPFLWTRVPGTGLEVYSYSEGRSIFVYEDEGSLVVMAPITSLVVRKELK
jgi:hypothetical protein